MSSWITVHNGVKRHAQLGWLSPAQASVHAGICAHLTGGTEFVNLWGQSGVGKTFVAWILSRSGLAGYVPAPSQVQVMGPLERIVCLDNAPSARTDVRDVVEELRYRGALQVIVITRQPIEDHVRHVELVLSDIDLMHINRVLYKQVGHVAAFEVAQDVGRLWRYLFPKGVS